MEKHLDAEDLVCGIVAGEVAAEVVYRDRHVIAFLDHRPVFKGHVLVCPVEHVDTFTDLPPELLAPLFAVVQRVAAAVTTAYGAQGSFTAINTVVSQSVPHLHVHVVPRTRGDGAARVLLAPDPIHRRRAGGLRRPAARGPRGPSGGVGRVASRA